MDVVYLFSRVTKVIDWLIPLLFAFAIIFFLWGLLKFFFAEGNVPAKRHDAMQLIIWGVVILFIMVSVWGLVRVVENTFNLQSGPLQRSELPSVQR